MSPGARVVFGASLLVAGLAARPMRQTVPIEYERATLRPAL